MAAKSVPLLDERGISLVINCTTTNHSYPDGISSRRASVSLWATRCTTDEEVLGVFDPLFDALDLATLQGQSVLIHCAAGMHRGGTVGVAWIMHARGLGRDAALSAAREGRPIISPGDIQELWRLLLRLERARGSRDIIDE